MFIKKFIGTKNFYRMVLALTIPIIIQNGITNFVNLLDNVMVGQLSVEEYNGVSIANQLVFVYNLALFGGLSGAGIFTSQFYGKDDIGGMRYTFRFKLITAAVITAIGAAVLLLFGETLISQFLTDIDSVGDPALAMNYGVKYLRIALLSTVPAALAQVYASSLRETGKTVPPMAASIAAVVVNAVFNYILIFGKLGFPALGVVGAALGTAIARVVELLIVLIWTHAHKARAPYIKGAYHSLVIPRALFRQILGKCLPLMLNELLWSSGMTVLNQCYSTRGMAAVSAVNIASTINNVFSIVFMSMGSAVAIIVGSQLGAGKIEEAKDTDRKIIAFSCVLCLGIGAGMAALAPLFTRAYNTTGDIRTLAANLIIIQACMMPFQSFAHNCYFTLRSGGQTFITFLFDSAFVWTISVPTAMVLSRLTDLPILLLYIICVSLDLIKCVIGGIMLKSGRWAKKLV